MKKQSFFKRKHYEPDIILPMQQFIDFALKVNSLLGKGHAKVEIFLSCCVMLTRYV
ncbi:hypothetical protein [Bacillus sp. GB_SG_008]|uniref:hypothetical protein n=1 Tax=Bacillus sp. GB_SG_008 TaxID=3454627 RepID=UPI003F858DC3